MPYDSIKDLPERVRHVLPLGAQKIFLKAFNSAFDEYGDETIAFRVAWSAVKKRYLKSDEGNWVRRPKSS